MSYIWKELIVEFKVKGKLFRNGKGSAQKVIFLAYLIKISINLYFRFIMNIFHEMPYNEYD